MTAISYRNGVAIGELIFYAPALLVALMLVIRHGFGTSAGWRFLLPFTLIRVLSASLQIATISYPTNTSLYIGAFVLLSVAISPLELTTLGLLTRVIDNINKTRHIFVTRNHLRMLGVVITAGLVLIIIGGVNAGNDYSTTGVYTPQSTSKAGIGLWIACFGGIVAATMATSSHVSHAERIEKRILLAVAISLPLMLIRIVYSAITLFAYETTFNPETGSVTILLCLTLLEEAAIVCIYEGVGITLNKVERPMQGEPIGGGASQDTTTQDGTDVWYK